MAKKTKTKRPSKNEKWETFLMTIAPVLAQALSQLGEQNRKIEEKKIEVQLKVTEALVKSVENLHLLIEDYRWKSLRDEANATGAAKR